MTDGDHPVADPRHLLGELDEGKIAAAVDLEEGKITAGIGAHHFGRIALVVVGQHLGNRAAFDHVVVGHGVPVGRNQEAGALCGRPVCTRGSYRQLKTALRERLSDRRSRALALRALDPHPDDGGFHPLHDVGETRRSCRGGKDIRPGGAEHDRLRVGAVHPG